jgi:hypothetical protein
MPSLASAKARSPSGYKKAEKVLALQGRAVDADMHKFHSSADENHLHPGVKSVCNDRSTHSHVPLALCGYATT